MGKVVLSVSSSDKIYDVHLGCVPYSDLNQKNAPIYLIDQTVMDLHGDRLRSILGDHPRILIEAVEESKTFANLSQYIDKLLEIGVTRNHCLVAVGGGIIQDITCFISSIILRGIPWVFYPTTLLAQGDSCIGSKSSVNYKGFKNILGTFRAPQAVVVDQEYLDTLETEDIHSGVGEMLKVHMIDGYDTFEKISKDFESIFTDKEVLRHYIVQSLRLKKRIIEIDEFDSDVRNLMNYGHTFGHAQESATDYQVPHGIAVTIGMKVANRLAQRLGRVSAEQVDHWNQVLSKNCLNFEQVKFDYDRMLASLKKDKKNRNKHELVCILPGSERLEKTSVPFDSEDLKNAVCEIAGCKDVGCKVAS